MKGSKRQASVIEFIESRKKDPSESEGELQADDKTETSDQARSQESQRVKQFRRLICFFHDQLGIMTILQSRTNHQRLRSRF